jgi:hypothetical protein
MIPSRLVIFRGHPAIFRTHSCSAREIAYELCPRVVDVLIEFTTSLSMHLSETFSCGVDINSFGEFRRGNTAGEYLPDRTFLDLTINWTAELVVQYAAAFSDYLRPAGQLESLQMGLHAHAL